MIIDTRNATKDLHVYKDRIIKLGAGNGVRSDSPHEPLEALRAAEAGAH